jgi:hypothetical protein
MQLLSPTLGPSEKRRAGQLVEAAEKISSAKGQRVRVRTVNRV